jgi:hypothetical protein
MKKDKKQHNTVLTGGLWQRTPPVSIPIECNSGGCCGATVVRPRRIPVRDQGETVTIIAADEAGARQAASRRRVRCR